MFIVIYGINNLGKSTQAKRLVERLIEEGYPAEYLKYPLYDIAPSGAVINEYLRAGNPFRLSPREFQLVNALNRTQYEPLLKQKLAAGVHIVAEDYTGSGIAWGIGTGVDERFLKTMNHHLLKEDIAFLFEGKRFAEATEQTHLHETDDSLQERVAEVYRRLGEEHQWIPIPANHSREEVHTTMWNVIAPALSRSPKAQ